MAPREDPFTSPPSSVAATRRPSWLALIALAALALTLSLIGAEAIVRIVLPQPLTPPIRESVDGVTLLVPGVRVRYFSPGEFDVHATVNEQRFRSTKTYERIPPPETIRIVALGDSFTFSTGVEDHETYPYLLEAALQSAWPQQNFEVINAGVHGTGLGDQALWYQRTLSGFQPDIVVVTLYANDIDDEISTHRFEKTGNSVQPRSLESQRQADREISSLRSLVSSIPGYFALSQHSQLLSLIRTTATRFLLARSAARANASTDGARHQAEEHATVMIADQLMWLRNEVEGRDAHLIAVLIPAREAIDAETAEHPAAMQSRLLSGMLLKLRERTDLDVLDLETEIRAATADSASPLYFDSDIHLRAEGYQLVADEVAKRVLAGLQSRRTVKPADEP
ncbi:MAG: hypothetical protein GY725_09930 [bacterium]|nr:hypothetical protein [bacterium]